MAIVAGQRLHALARRAFRLRNVRTVSMRRLVTSVILLALIPPATEVDALAAVSAVVSSLIVHEAMRYREARSRVRHPQEASHDRHRLRDVPAV